jgi:hypothetical protein
MLSIDPQTLWIDGINLALGIVTLCCLAMIASVVINEVIDRWVDRLLGTPGADAHTLRVCGHGATMTGGGEPIDDARATGPEYYGF